MKEDISTNAVVFNNPYTGELFIFDNDKSRYGYAQPEESVAWITFNGLNSCPVTKIVGRNGVALMQVHNREQDTYRLLIFRRSDKIGKFYDNNNNHYIEPFLGDDGYLSYIDRDLESMQAYIGYMKTDLTPNGKYDLNADSDHGTYVTVGLDMIESGGRIEFPEGHHLASGFSFTALNQNHSTDVFVVRSFSDSLSLNNQSVRNWMQMMENVHSQDDDESDMDLEEQKRILERRLLGKLLDNNACLVGADWDFFDNGDPKEYYDNLHFHHPETYIDGMLMIDRGDYKDKRADLVTVARDCYLFVTNIWLDSNGKPQYDWHRRILFEDIIRCLAYDNQRNIVYYVGDSGQYGCLDANNKYTLHSNNYGKADFRIMKINSVTTKVAAYNTDKMVVVFDDSDPFSMKIQKQIPLLSGISVVELALHNNYIYVQYQNGHLERYDI
ncbi:MAG: hypothetical protein IJ524_01710 [Bacteroidales bacterium]|nr:hypothetical protein [Bacteroidales bacterium]